MARQVKRWESGNSNFLQEKLRRKSFYGPPKEWLFNLSIKEPGNVILSDVPSAEADVLRN